MDDLIDRGASIRFISNIERDDEDRLFTFEEIKKMLWDAPAVNRWIPVEDALPEIKEFNISDTVLCYCDSGTLAIARLEANGFGQVGFNCEKDDEYHHSAGNVLYWMTIPEIPEQTTEANNENR